MMALPEKPTAPRPANSRPRRRAFAGTSVVGDSTLTRPILRSRRRAVRLLSDYAQRNRCTARARCSIWVGKFRILDELAISQAFKKLQQIRALRLRQDKGTDTGVLQRILL